MKKIYFTFFILMLCTASVFSAQLYNNAVTKEYKPAHPATKDSGNIISNMIALPSFK